MKKPRPSTRRPGSAGFERVLVLADGGKLGVQQLLAKLVPWLEQRVAAVETHRDVRAFCEQLGVQRSNGSALRPDLAVVIGGDGAILAAARAYQHEPVPMLGINFGRIGFLAATPATRWQESLEAVLEGALEPEQRMRVSAELSSSGGRLRAIALNEVVVQRGAHQGMLTCALSVGSTWVNTYRADGLIVATPSGSTAYSLSAGGPILAPDMKALVVTPICPQGLSNRPIVLPTDSELALVLSHSAGLTTLVVDGQSFFQLRQGDTVVVRRHAKPYPLYSMPGLDPYRRLRERLGWRGSIEEQQYSAPRGAPRAPEHTDQGEDAL